jgi:hypothetical protein
MPGCSHITNISASGKVRHCPADIIVEFPHYANMARRGTPKDAVSWYLPEWMAARGLEGRGAQTRMRELTGWSKATMSQLFNGEQDYSPAIIKAAAKALRCEDYELLMHPDRAMALRRQREDSLRIVADTETLRTGTHDE